ncbi:hypothetical protein ACQ4LK_24100, partial [Bacillus pumilus]
YSYATLGEFLAFLMGWDLMLEYVIALSAVASGWSSYFQSLLSGFGLHIPKALSAAPGLSLIQSPSPRDPLHDVVCRLLLEK